MPALTTISACNIRSATSRIILTPLCVTLRGEGKSLNEVAVAALVRGAGLEARERVKRDLSDIAGTWQEDPAFDSAIAEQQKIDEAMWQ